MGEFLLKSLRKEFNQSDDFWIIDLVMKRNILFIGTFLSSSRGTQTIAETLSKSLSLEGFNIKLSSRIENRFIRVLDIILNILVDKGKCVHIDVFSGSAFYLTEIALYFSKLRGKKTLITLHGGGLVEFSEANASRVSRVMRNADYIQTPSKYLQSCFSKYAISYLPNSIELTKFQFAGMKGRSKSILWVRAFTHIYNPDIPIRILYELRKRNVNLSLTMVGPDLGLLSECMALVKELNLEDSVSFIGSVANDELYQYYQTHTIFLNTTSYESFGMAIVEAAACGIPVISNNVGEIPYIWEDKKNIMLVNNNCIKSFCSHIEYLINSEITMQNLSLNARVNVERFDSAVIKKQWVDLLATLT